MTKTTKRDKQMLPKILRLPAVMANTGLSRSTIYDRINPSSPRYDPLFPKRVKLGAKSMGFLESELKAWIDSRINAR